MERKQLKWPKGNYCKWVVCNELSLTKICTVHVVHQYCIQNPFIALSS